MEPGVSPGKRGASDDTWRKIMAFFAKELAG
jgi:hypothetical protein